jgi:hypothetical protein
LASDVTSNNGVLQMPDYKKPPIRPEMAGGLFDMAAMMAFFGAWNGLKPGTTDYMSARSQVSRFLRDNGFKDGAHTADTCFDSTETTECGAWMKKKSGMITAVETIALSRSSGTDSIIPLDQAVAAYSGMSPEQLVNGEKSDTGPAEDEAVRRLIHESYLAIRQRQSELVDSDAFAAFNPVAIRDELKKTSPESLEVLFSDLNHPTHNHKEPALVIIDVEDPELTLDRDALYEIDGFAPFVDNRNLRRRIAEVMAQTSEEATRLLIAGDVATVDVSNELVAPGMPVILIT